MDPHPTGPDETTYSSRRRQVQMCLAVVGLYLVTFSVVLEPDYVTHTRPKPSAYLWQVVPFALLTLFMAVRAYRSRVVTTPTALHVHRVTSHEELPWADVRGFEVHPSPSGRFNSVVARRATGRTVRIALYRAPVKGERAPEALRFAEQLREDRAARVAAHPAAAASASPSAAPAASPGATASA